MTLNVPGSASDQTLGFSYNAARQIANNTRSKDSYAWSGHFNTARLTSVDGLNRLLDISIGGTPLQSFGPDGRGNQASWTRNGTTSAYTYNADNIWSVICLPLPKAAAAAAAPMAPR